jgi:hypothetical protein
MAELRSDITLLRAAISKLDDGDTRLLALERKLGTSEQLDAYQAQLGETHAGLQQREQELLEQIHHMEKILTSDDFAQ